MNNPAHPKPEGSSRLRKWGIRIAGLILVLALIGGVIGYSFYQKIFAPNLIIEQAANLFVPKGTSYEELLGRIKDAKILNDYDSFEWVANQKNLSAHVYAGRYQIQPGLNNNDLVNLLRSGKTKDVKVTFNYNTRLPDLAGKIAPQIQADSLELLQVFQDHSRVQRLGFKLETFISMFIPNTYQFNWATDASQFVDRMKKEYDNFWNENRLAKAKALNMTPQEVATLASIVQWETGKEEERFRIAGVYVNRLERGIKLDADPTLLFVINDPTRRRVLNKDKELDSPYNTYKYAGLPPGPILLPQPQFVDAVLDYEEHDYIFFCAKEDFSGYTNFAKTYAQHLVNARKYQQALNAKGIYR
ncbi:MAG: endolytic transglycosylase MltG [Bacteroidota bacterium]